jgi:hypothetical protein
LMWGARTRFHRRAGTGMKTGISKLV